ncbi:hypothetical protein LTR37_011987 [Vermiconidia calcicola]|uniref:Uncharacterized protein n=1 Tax=Vermiconidia calcicola TaxID=1690605 RepID=A0ACC3N0M3_9PEZI|nr:hypothetical protein LTR37_011987 [Vermiconidia calcicola]
MQSSPPQRGWERPSSPTGDSQYSLDLAALDLDSRSGASSPLPVQHVDRVLSEDIDGPSDFTLNMEAWMRGGTMKKGTVRRRGSALGSVKESKKEGEVEGSTAHRGLLSPWKERAEDAHSLSHHTPEDSPPRESVWDSSRREEAGEKTGSDWDPYGDAESTTPEPLPHQHFLQPTVEDYYSELTPARGPSNHIPRPAQSNRTIPESVDNSPLKTSQPSTPGRPSSETISPARSPVLQRSEPVVPAPRNFSSQTDEAEGITQQLHELQHKCQHLGHLNATLNRAVEEERRQRQQETAAHEAKLAEAARRECDLVEMKDQAYQHKEDFRQEFSDLRLKLQRHENELQAKTQEMGRAKDQHSTEMQKLRQFVDREKQGVRQEVRALADELDIARRARDEAEEAARVAREELEQYRKNGNDGEMDELDRMRLSLRQDGLSTRVTELEEQLLGVKSESDRLSVEHEQLKAEKKAADEIASNVRAEISVLKQTHGEENVRLTGDHRRAVSLVEGLQSKLKELRQQLHDQQSAHDAEIEKLQRAQDDQRKEPEPIPQPTPSEEEMQQINDELESKQTLLNELRLERDELQDALAAAQLEMSDLSAVNLALDARVSDSVRKREAYWRSRLEDMEKERKVMAKALMRQWGREEVGAQEPRQAYEYASVKKGGDKNRALV